ncbi:52 kDa repressor of the inhibitor of the protein kinase, partial [Corchorus olitorius]
MKSRTINSLFKKKDAKGTSTTSSNQEVTADDTTPQELPSVPETCEETRPSKIPRVETDTIDLSKLESDPAL